MKHIALPVAALIGASLMASPYTADTASREPTIKLFLQACAIPYTHAELVEREIAHLGFTEVQGDSAVRYLGGAEGRVWAGVFQSRRFAIALRPEVLCTVIAHDGNSAEIKTAVESWLPPPGSSIDVTREAIPSSGSLETMAYELRGGKVQERWIVTVSTDPDSQTVAMLPWSRL